ncbi:MAG: beta-phosphoglucomutase [Verrucomicrobiota bacterium]
MSKLEAVIFDLDGVIVSTDHYHYLGWKRIADEEGIPFDEKKNDRLRGVSRMESLEILLEPATRTYSEAEKTELATRKNDVYRDLLRQLKPGDTLPGAIELCDALRAAEVKLAIGSSSRNSPAILEYLGLDGYFHATADGNDIRNSKPDPEVFLLAAERLGVAPAAALVVEDAEAGVSAAVNGGFKCLAVGAAAGDERAHLSAPDLAQLTARDLQRLYD